MIKLAYSTRYLHQVNNASSGTYNYIKFKQKKIFAKTFVFTVAFMTWKSKILKKKS